MSDAYANVARGKLKLKTDGEITKKKKKNHDKEKVREQVQKTDPDTVEVAQPDTSPERKLTKAEMSFKKMQEKTVSRSLRIN